MAGTTTAAYDRAVELLSHGGWMPRAQVLAEVGKVFPPGVAVRHLETVRQYKAVAEGYANTAKDRKIVRSQEFLIASGQRALAAKVLNNKTRFETKTDNGVVMVRLVPVKPHWRTGMGRREIDQEEA